MSSTTPSPTPPHPPKQPVSLTERRKAETRMAIARAAAGLFVRHGLRATRAEDIAQAAGVAPRTFYRYFATKEEAVAPLYAAGARRWVEAVRTAPPGATVPQALEAAVRHTLSPGLGVSVSSWEWVRTLIRLAMENPSLRKVWAEVCQDTERELADALSSRLTALTSGQMTGAQLPDGNRDNVAGSTAESIAAPAVPPRLHFAAAVASAAVRVAVEDWAAEDTPATGPRGPVERALGNLAALRDFPWRDLGAPTTG
ncbi:TetR/AcrR family transcriptional regulator [Streptomyces bullii]|uniref:TetR/AcrR family transcriptional regulator n=1 Tax=Streptomyces bullii TaxID=349910 RepID=A0ABW0UUT5_9ACTN